MIPLAIDVPYALEISVVTETKIPVAGWREVTTRSYAQVDFDSVDGRWVQNQKACAVVVEGGRVTFPETFVGSIPAQSFDVSWTDGVYVGDPGPNRVGLQRTVDVLPRDAEDPGVVDQDSDGNPGVTVFMDLPIFGALEVYIVQIAHSRMIGAVENGEIRGKVEVARLEQRTIGASLNLFARNVATRVLPGRSSFRIVPDPGRRCKGAFEP